MARVSSASLVRLTPLSPNEPRGYEGVVSAGGESSDAHVNFIDWATIGTIVAEVGIELWDWWQRKHDNPGSQPPSPPPSPPPPSQSQPQNGINTTALLVAIVALAAVFFIARR